MSKNSNNLVPGIYESVVNKDIEQTLAQLSSELYETAPLEENAMARTYAMYVQQAVERALTLLRAKSHKDYSDKAQHLVNQLVNVIDKSFPEEFEGTQISRGTLLQSIGQNTLRKKRYCRPQTSIASTSLLAGLNGEPSLLNELKLEIASADRIDWLVSFIKLSGITPLLQELQSFTASGKQLRIITTTYTGATDMAALQRLAKLHNVDIRVEYDGLHSRHHAKAYIFHRNNGFSTVYIGSSNLSKTAQTTGLEWNVKLSAIENPDVFNKIQQTFEHYWSNTEIYAPYRGAIDDQRLQEALIRARQPFGITGSSTDEGNIHYYFDLRPYPFQQKILDSLSAQRQGGLRKSLIVAATGTGKTAISAFDYKNLCQRSGNRLRLLFVAHRKEILEQSLGCFRSVLKDQNFGDLLVGNNLPTTDTHIFASIQSLKNRYRHWSANDFDVMIIDESHHATAQSYDFLFHYFQPKFLIGLTATPERMDGSSILPFFDYRIAAEIRLPDAIERKLLCPFNYFVVNDPISLKGLSWRAGGYAETELETIYTAGRAASDRNNAIQVAMDTYLPARKDIRAIAFCASVKHAQYMTEVFKSHGYAAVTITGQTKDEERRNVREKLESGEIQIISTMDVFNEGVDIPCINSVLFLRPTKSLTIYLQQLGRGLRLWEGKDALYVLDFVGEANEKFSFEERYRALLRSRSINLKAQIESGLLDLPAGCSISMERVAQEKILENIRANFDGLRSLIRRLGWYLQDNPQKPCVTDFCRQQGLTLIDFYTLANKSGYFSQLIARHPANRTPTELHVPDCLRKTSLAMAFLQIALIDDLQWIDFLIAVLNDFSSYDKNNPIHRTYLLMFYQTVSRTELGNLPASMSEIETLTRTVIQTPWLRNELLDILTSVHDNPLQETYCIDWGFPCPIKAHATYSRAQITLAFNNEMRRSIREGVFWDPTHKTDLFFVTINKNDSDFSPTTRYEDFFVNDTLLNWQSQSTTTPESKTGQRYISHMNPQNPSKVAVFVRSHKHMRGTNMAMPFTCVGLCNFVKYQGSKPMSILWQLQRKLSAKIHQEVSLLD